MLHLATNDNFCHRPRLPDDSPVVLVSVGSPSWAHALSFLQDVVPVSAVYLVDVSTLQLAFARRMVELLRVATDPLDYLSRLLCCRFTQPSWEGADLSGLYNVWGLAYTELTVCDGVPCLVYGPGPTVSHVHHPEAMRERLALWFHDLGWDFGYLQAELFPPQLPAQVYFWPGRLSEALPCIVAENRGSRIVVWLSNAAGYPPRLSADPGFGPDWVREFDRQHQDLFFWISEQTADEVVQNFYGKEYRLGGLSPEEAAAQLPRDTEFVFPDLDVEGLQGLRTVRRAVGVFAVRRCSARGRDTSQTLAGVREAAGRRETQLFWFAGDGDPRHAFLAYFAETDH